MQYKKSTDTTFTDWTHSGVGTITTITETNGLDAGTSYQVRVRAKSDGVGF